MPEPQYQEPDWSAKGNVLNSSVRWEGGLGINGVGVGQHQIQRVLFENGEIWDIPDEGPAQKVGDDHQTAVSWQNKNKTPAAAKVAPAGAVDKTDKYYLQWNQQAPQDADHYVSQGPDGSWLMNWEGQVSSYPTQADAEAAYTAKGSGRYEKYANPNYDADLAAQQAELRAAQLASAKRTAMGPQLQPRYPDQAERSLLENQQLKQKLRGDLDTAREQTYGMIGHIRDMLASGEIDEKKANSLMDLAYQNLDATMKGTTPWQMESFDKEMQQRERSQKRQVGAGLAQGLFGQGADVYGKILSSAGPPLNFNPLAMAKDFVDQFGTMPATDTQPQFNPMARALLGGAMQPQQPPAWGNSEEDMRL